MKFALYVIGVLAWDILKVVSFPIWGTAVLVGWLIYAFCKYSVEWYEDIKHDWNGQ